MLNVKKYFNYCPKKTTALLESANNA